MTVATGAQNGLNSQSSILLKFCSVAPMLDDDDDFVPQTKKGKKSEGKSGQQSIKDCALNYIIKRKSSSSSKDLLYILL
jgi:hypothetical protein